MEASALAIAEALAVGYAVGIAFAALILLTSRGGD